MEKLTRKETIRLTNGLPLYKVDFIPNKLHFKKLGYNHGVYGWNYSVYYNELDNNYYIEGYRNFPTTTVYKHNNK